VVSIFILIIFYLTAAAQDAQFSQFYSNALYLAPSFAGASGGSRITANYRDQWIGLPSTFRTYSFSYDHYFSDFRSGIGFLGYKDAAGTVNLVHWVWALYIRIISKSLIMCN